MSVYFCYDSTPLEVSFFHYLSIGKYSAKQFGDSTEDISKWGI